MKKILVLCTGNSCRSIMAEALINTLASQHYSAVSAGSNPTGEIHPNSIKTLNRHGISTEGYHSKSWDIFTGESFDLVITVCDAAAAEQCPAFLGQHNKLHWSTSDPATVKGTESDINRAFEDVFFALHHRIKTELI